MSTAVKKFAPLAGVLILLIIVALAGAALSSNKKPPTLDPTALSIRVSSTEKTAPTEQPLETVDANDPTPLPAEPVQQVPAPAPAPAPPAAVPQNVVPPVIHVPQLPPIQVPPIPPAFVQPQAPLMYQDVDDMDDDWDDDD
ncbi:hypothetical protein P4N68_12540 [Corynebacterium felinum]|uniref:Uncharacterized protein n=1 Tax=Corynebacterium felinum TaxID=131318 RepID=A0ABU2B9J4_9CORY|nr:hypothetical protein [Corynebacterium felinum]MDF5821895.1 hypothetical protein [Corynebacterium felinum]MDR7355292.1 hypothetical protein [Corynebacterium felinum]WJY94645.1 hypothetical protein CFELI_05080 [Corynebacterium felinum]